MDAKYDVQNEMVTSFLDDILEMTTGLTVPENIEQYELSNEDMLSVADSSYTYIASQMLHAGLLVDMHEALVCMFASMVDEDIADETQQG